MGRQADRPGVVALGAILAFVLVTRLVGADWAQQPRYYFSQVSTLYLAQTLQAGHYWTWWAGLLGNLQVIWDHQSPIQAPVSLLVQWWLGPSLELPTYIGCVWAVLAVLLAWRLGTAMESPAFGITFAAFVAISPLQLTWSRLGGIYIGASVGALFAMWAGWHTRRLWQAPLLGVVAWASVYWYYSARVAIGLAFVGLWAQGGWPWGRTLLACLAFGACWYLTPGDLWPHYGSYLGSNTGPSLWTVLQTHWTLTLQMFGWACRAITLAKRLPGMPGPWTGTLFDWHPVSGGLILAPTLVLGLVGAVVAIRGPRPRWAWLIFVLLGFLPAYLGFPSARRFLVMDVGWCALAALGLVTLVRGWGQAIVLSLIGLYGMVVLFGSWAMLPANHVHIPFGESGFGDGATCLGCLDQARAWRSEFEAGRMVVVFDSDPYRENATSPGGIDLYGKTVALQAGRPDLFVNYSAVTAGRDWNHPMVGKPVPDLETLIMQANPTAVVWWFVDPSPWETTLAHRFGRVTILPMRPRFGATRTQSEATLRVQTCSSEALTTLRDFEAETTASSH